MSFNSSFRQQDIHWEEGLLFECFMVTLFFCGKELCNAISESIFIFFLFLLTENLPQHNLRTKKKEWKSSSLIHMIGLDWSYLTSGLPCPMDKVTALALSKAWFFFCINFTLKDFWWPLKFHFLDREGRETERVKKTTASKLPSVW